MFVQGSHSFVMFAIHAFTCYVSDDPLPNELKLHCKGPQCAPNTFQHFPDNFSI